MKVRNTILQNTCYTDLIHTENQTIASPSSTSRRVHTTRILASSIMRAKYFSVSGLVIKKKLFIISLNAKEWSREKLTKSYAVWMCLHKAEKK